MYSSLVRFVVTLLVVLCVCFCAGCGGYANGFQDGNGTTASVNGGSQQEQSSAQYLTQLAVDAVGSALKNTARCNDGVYTDNKNPDEGCNGHNGVAQYLIKRLEAAPVNTVKREPTFR